MQLKTFDFLILPGLSILGFALILWPNPTKAQAAWPAIPPPVAPVPTTPSAQRNALNNVRAQVGWLQNATRTASNYATGAAEMIWQQFQMLRGSFGTLTMTLNPRQAASGANELAELAAGLDIIQEAFNNYENDLAGGRARTLALKDLSAVLRESSDVWLRKLNQDCARLRVGW